MANHKQKMIVTTEVGQDGNIAVSIDFFPKLPTTEGYKKLSVEKQGLIAIIKEFGKNTHAFRMMLSQATVPLKPEEPIADTQQG